MPIQPPRSLRAFFAVFLIACAGPVMGQEGLPAVTVVSPQMTEIVGQVQISGTTVAREEALVYPQVAGLPIRELAVDVGESVGEGDVLARLDVRTLEAQLLQARAELLRAQSSERQASSQISSARAAQRQAEQEYDRQQSLRDRGTVSQAALEQASTARDQATAQLTSALDGLGVAKAAVQVAESQLKLAELNLDFGTITAPVGGLISERNGRIGGIASAGGEPLFRIVRGGEIEMEGEVLETELGALSVGQPVQMRVAGIGQMEGEVRLISPRVDPASRLGTVRIAMEGEGLRSGLFVAGTVVTARRNSLAVPSTAVLTDDSGSYVLVEKDGLLERREVTAGLINGDLREVLKGLEAGDRVVARAAAFFHEGDKVRPVEAAEGGE